MPVLNIAAGSDGFLERCEQSFPNTADTKGPGRSSWVATVKLGRLASQTNNARGVNPQAFSAV